jgi:lipopolysaccharide export system protein LptA
MRKIYQLFFFRLVVIVFLFLSHGVLAQKTIIKHQEDRLIGKTIEGRTVNVLIGNVILYRDTATLYCDSAIMDRELNTFDGYGHVRMLMGDSVELYGDKIYYNMETKIGEVFGNVILIDNRATLYTNYLHYNRLTKTAFYNQNGRIVDNDNVLTSKLGYYFTQRDEFFFRDSVVVTTPDYVIDADTMRYNSETEFVYFLGPTTLTGKDEFMFAKSGWSDTQNGITSLKDDALVKQKQHVLKGDSIYYEKATGFGQVFKDAVLIDTEKEIIIQGNFVEYLKEQLFAYATDSAQAIIIDGVDSLFLHGDTLRLEFDTANEAQKLHAYKSVKFFRESMQGACDLLIYDVIDSIINMKEDPVLWSDENQLTSDSMKIFITDQALDSLVLYDNAFINSQEKDTSQFNQIKGRHVIGYFNQNELVKIIVNGNSETIYYVRDEETQGLIGINKALADNMIIRIKNRAIQTITYYKQPKMTLFRESELTGADRKLDGFKWLILKRPLSKFDIFRRD